MNQNTYSIKIGGQAGQGIKSAGQILAKVATRSGYSIFTYTEFPSVIRGGHNVTQVAVSAGTLSAAPLKTDLLIALNQDTIDRHANKVEDGGIIVFDGDKRIDTTKIKATVNLCPVPLAKFSVEAGDKELSENTVALGASLAVLGGDLTLLTRLLEDEFKSKGNEIVETNKKAAVSGYEFARDKYADRVVEVLKPCELQSKQMVISGSEAVGLGAIAAGMQFAAIYPMSPISNVLHVLAKYQEKYGFIYKQPEDEISAINMAIGAAYAGARSMTATSGGGFALMSEGYGLAGMTETPIVIIEGMRPGPATGLPTWSGQGDLRFVLHAHQGDFPRIVIAAGDIKEAFEMTLMAFNLAEKYQTPVVVLVDKNICDGDRSYPFFDISSYKPDRGKLTRERVENFRRFEISDDGVSLRSIPGFGNFFIANSDEHDDEGFSTEEVDITTSQQEKRMKKLLTCEKEDMELPKLYGPDQADITIVSWGSNKGSILEAIKGFPNVNFMHITWMNPFPAAFVEKVLKRAKYVIDIESNLTAQLAGVIAEKTGILIADKYLKFDGRPFFPEEIVDRLNKIKSNF